MVYFSEKKIERGVRGPNCSHEAGGDMLVLLMNLLFGINPMYIHFPAPKRTRYDKQFTTFESRTSLNLIFPSPV